MLFDGWAIFHCICVPRLLFPFLCWWIFRLFPYFGYSKQCCNEHWGECILSGHVFPWICPGVGLQDHVVTPFVIFEDSSILFSTLTVSIYCLHSHKQCRGLPLSPYPLPHWLLVDFLMIAILTGVRSYLTVVFIGISQMISNVVKTNNPIKKMGRRSPETFLQRRHADGQEAHGNMLYVFPFLCKESNADLYINLQFAIFIVITYARYLPRSIYKDLQHSLPEAAFLKYNLHSVTFIHFKGTTQWSVVNSPAAQPSLPSSFGRLHYP